MEQNMENREIAIKISNVKKMYKLGQIGGGTLKADLESWWARKRGKEDPNLKIGQEDRARLVGTSFMALNGIDLTVYKGEALGIIGGNGAGKSTLLKLLSQVTAPSSGQIELWGRVASMLEVGTGFNGEMTGRENIYMNGAILGMTRAEIDAKMEDIIEFSEVRDFIDTPVKRYSSGMYVKLAFSVAAHLDSEIMIMDEVLAVGDMAFQKKCLDKMRDVAKKEGRTVLYVSHNMNTIRQLCDRCVVLEQGTKVYDGDVEKGIGVYLHIGLTSANTLLNYDVSQRQDFLVNNNKVGLQSFELLSHTDYCFHYGETIRFKLAWDVYEFVPNLSLRVKLVNDYGVQIANFFIDSFMDAIEGSYQKVFEMDLSNLMYGKYNVTFVFSGTVVEGESTLVEAINNAFSFEIKKREQDMYWSSQYWGNVKLDSIRIIE